MALNFGLQNSPSTGFECLLRRRAVMQQWSAVSHLLTMRKNQEAAEIVQSFQHQLQLESSVSTTFNGKAA